MRMHKSCSWLIIPEKLDQCPPLRIEDWPAELLPKSCPRRADKGRKHALDQPCGLNFIGKRRLSDAVGTKNEGDIGCEFPAY